MPPRDRSRQRFASWAPRPSHRSPSTPDVGAILAAAGVVAIPEARCYLTHQGERYDFTGLPPGAASPFDSLIEERVVAPDELPFMKERYHRDALAKWASTMGMDPESAWCLREECLARLVRIAESHGLPARGQSIREITAYKAANV